MRSARLGRCLAVDHGTVTRGGTATVDGQPLRLQSTGATRPGGATNKACTTTGGLREAGTDVTLGSFDEDLRISAPAGATTPAQAVGG